MNESDAAVVLSLCATFDRRTVGRADATAWARVLEDVSVEDACAAVDDWYSTRRDWIMPADVIAGAKRIRDRRIGAQRRAALDAEIAAENPGEIANRERPLLALMSGSPVKPVPRPDWSQRHGKAPVTSKPPFTEEELAAARRLLDESKPEASRQTPPTEDGETVDV